MFQLSLDLETRAATRISTLARELKPLREKGVLMIGSGNLVHNLMALAPGAPAYDWARGLRRREARQRIEARDAIGLADALGAGRAARLAHPTPEHFLPALFPLGVADEKDELSFFNDSFDMGSISMRSFLLS